MEPEQSLTQMTNDIETILLERGNSSNRVSQYHYIFRVFIAYSKAMGETGFSRNIIELCLKEHYGIKDFAEITSRRQHYRKTVIRAYKMLCDHADGTPFADRYHDFAPILCSEEYMNTAALFFSDCEKKGFARSTLKLQRAITNRLFSFFEENKIYLFSEWNINLLNQFLYGYSGYSQVTIKGVRNDLRRFCRFLYLNQFIDKDFGEKIDRIKTRHQTKIPSVWSQENVLKLLAAVDRGNPTGKRNYAVLLLVTRLGLRIGDVVRLQFENIDWHNNRITLTQSKTGYPICLPLLKDVGWALIDYIQYGRPQLDSPFVFLTHITPIKEISTENHLYEIVKKHAVLARITGAPMHKSGMHSLRHSLANRLLENYEPLSTISTALGHRSPDSASYYLKANVEQLRECALVPSEAGI